MSHLHSYTGHCHCGNVTVVFDTDLTPEKLDVRSCQCAFCSRQGARCTSDPLGSVRIAVRDPARLLRYHFGLMTADFLLCRDCGAYIGAVMQDGGAAYATININNFDRREDFGRAGVPVDYDAEDETGRRARRRANWTPVTAMSEGGF